MSTQHEISEFIENLPLKKVRCKGYRPDDVYDAVYRLSTMYNQLLSEVYEENTALKKQISIVEPEIVCEEESAEATENVEQERPKLSGKEIQRLRRTELLEVLLLQSKENDVLRSTIQEKNGTINELKKQLNSKKIDLEKAGTIAEASFQMNGVLETVEKAAQQYLDNLQDLYERENALTLSKEEEFQNRCAAVMQATVERCNFMKEEMEAQCKEMWDATEQKCMEREVESERICKALDQKAKDDVDKRWMELSKRLEAFYASHEGLRELLAMKK